MISQFRDQMAGRYQEWYQKFQNSRHANKIEHNAGLMGGTRLQLIDLFEEMVKVMSDPQTIGHVTHREIDTNMGALNYVVHSFYSIDDIVSGAPLHGR